MRDEAAVDGVVGFAFFTFYILKQLVITNLLTVPLHRSCSSFGGKCC